MQPRVPITLSISRDMLYSMSLLAKRALELSLVSLYNRDKMLAINVIGNDKAINSFEIDVDNSSFNFLALTAKDLPDSELRFVLAIQKINAILERIGDHAVNIAESAETICVKFKETALYNLPKMGECARAIFSDALSAFFESDDELANDVLKRDDEIDRMNVAITEAVKADVMTGSLSFDAALEIIRVSKNLERIADLSSNIAEETLFVIGGTIIKHHTKEQTARPIEYDIIPTNATMLTIG